MNRKSTNKTVTIEQPKPTMKDWKSIMLSGNSKTRKTDSQKILLEMRYGCVTEE